MVVKKMLSLGWPTLKKYFEAFTIKKITFVLQLVQTDLRRGQLKVIRANFGGQICYLLKICFVIAEIQIVDSRSCVRRRRFKRRQNDCRFDRISLPSFERSHL